MFTQIYKHSGIVFHYVDMNNLDNVTAVLNEKQNDLVETPKSVNEIS
jgi:cystathionine beta-lyase